MVVVVVVAVVAAIVIVVVVVVVGSGGGDFGTLVVVGDSIPNDPFKSPGGCTPRDDLTGRFDWSVMI